MKNLILLIGIALLITGCAPTYQKSGFWGGGYDEMKMQDNIFKITFEGNTHTSGQIAEDFGLLRCAETTLENGYNYFIIEKSKTEERTSTHTTPTEIERTSSISEEYIVTGGETHTSTKPTVAIIIECFKEKPENVSGIIYDAEQIKTNIKNKYKIE